MARDFSLAHLTLLSCSPPEMVEIAARTGYSHVSLRPLPVSPNEPKYPMADDKNMTALTKQALRDTGVKLLDIELARITADADMKSYVPAMEVAAELGGKMLLSSGWTPDKAFVTERFAELCDLARPFGLFVGFEFVTFASIGTLQDAADVVRGADRGNGGICLDTLHWYRSNTKISELTSLPKSWFRFMQLCDAPANAPTDRDGLIAIARGGRLALGAGGLDVAAVVNALPEMPYSLEIPNTRHAIEMSPIARAKHYLDTANAYLDKHASYENAPKASARA